MTWNFDPNIERNINADTMELLHVFLNRNTGEMDVSLAFLNPLGNKLFEDTHSFNKTETDQVLNDIEVLCLADYQSGGDMRLKHNLERGILEAVAAANGYPGSFV